MQKGLDRNKVGSLGVFISELVIRLIIIDREE
jgi:hypothetical protein